MADTTVNVNGTITDNSVTNAKLANMAAARVKMRAVGAGTGDPIDGTADELSTLLDTAADPFLRTSNSSAFAPESHTHIIGDVNGLQTALDGKSALSHSHAIADVTGLQTELDGKAAYSHTHTFSQITDCASGVETAYTGTDAYTAGAQPNGTVNKRQFYTQVGNLVTWQISIAWQNPSATCTNATLTFPTQFPTPAIPTGFTGASVRIWQCFPARLLGTTSGTMTNAASYMISRNAANNGFEIMSTGGFTSGSYRVFIFGGTYFTQ